MGRWKVFPSGWPHVFREEGLANILDSCRHIRELYLSNKCVISGESFAGQSCPTLEVLSLGNCHVAETGLQAVILTCPAPQELNIGSNLGLTGSSLLLIPNNCPNMKLSCCVWPPCPCFAKIFYQKYIFLKIVHNNPSYGSVQKTLNPSYVLFTRFLARNSTHSRPRKEKSRTTDKIQGLFQDFKDHFRFPGPFKDFKHFKDLYKPYRPNRLAQTEVRIL